MAGDRALWTILPTDMRQLRRDSPDRCALVECNEEAAKTVLEDNAETVRVLLVPPGAWGPASAEDVFQTALTLFSREAVFRENKQRIDLHFRRELRRGLRVSGA